MSVASWRDRFEQPAEESKVAPSPFGPRKPSKQQPEKVTTQDVKTDSSPFGPRRFPTAPTKAGFANVEVTAVKPRVAVEKVLLIEACLLQRRDSHTAMLKKWRLLIETIQTTYREYLRSLGATREERSLSRTQKAFRASRIRNLSTALVLEARERGSRVVAQECQERELMRRTMLPFLLQLCQQEEQHQRKVLAGEEARLKLLFTNELPAEFQAGTIGDEWHSRNHIVAFFLFERRVLLQQLIAKKIADVAQTHFSSRSLIVKEEQAERVQLIKFSRQDLCWSNFLELIDVESEHRQLVMRQAACSFSTVVQAYYSFLMIALSHPESALRGELVHKESFFWMRLLDQFFSTRYELTFANVLHGEFKNRCGNSGIEAQERGARRELLNWHFGTLLLRIQGGGIADNETEAGGRLTIELVELSHRKHILRLVEEDALHTFLPVLEKRQRERICSAESMMRKSLFVASGDSLMTALWFEEPMRRHRVERAARQGTVALVFQCAQIKLLQQERTMRNEIEVAFSCLNDRLTAFCLLAHLELSRRKQLRKLERKMRKRARLDEQKFSEVLQEDEPTHEIFDVDEVDMGYFVAVQHNELSQLSRSFPSPRLPWK